MTEHRWVHHGPEDDDPYCRNCGRPMVDAEGEPCRATGSHFPTDWHEIVTQFNTALDGHHARPYARDIAPRLRQPNFMTPERLGWLSAEDGTIVEASTGMFLGDRLVALSWPRSDDERNGIVESWTDLVERLRS